MNGDITRDTDRCHSHFTLSHIPVRGGVGNGCRKNAEGKGLEWGFRSNLSDPSALLVTRCIMG